MNQNARFFLTLLIKYSPKISCIENIKFSVLYIEFKYFEND
jgi:hypothetical protein